MGKVVAIGIDGPNTALFDDWMRQGLLPNLAKLEEQGFSGRYAHTKRFRNERCWDTFLGGRELAGTGSVFLPQRYDYYNESLQREGRYQPFYAFAGDKRVCIFDLPAAISPAVNGLQISGWGSELNAAAAMSRPETLIAEIIARHGADPKLKHVNTVRDAKTGEMETSYVLPSLYDLPALLDWRDRLKESVRRRCNISLDLLAREPWDLFLALFPEAHTANHMLWHLDQPHPLSPPSGPVGALLDVFREIDTAVGRILAALPDRRNVVVFSIDHTAVNNMDLPGMALLPELLYRWSFPGQQALAAGDASTAVAPALAGDLRHWKHQVWDLLTTHGNAVLASPERLEAEGSALSWNPAAWYQPRWPDMRAFALPSVADGFIRLNVKGRESHGLVEPEEFGATLDEVTALLERTRNPRTGAAIVKRVLRMRQSPAEQAEIAPDLVVCWDDRYPSDVLDSPELGRIGPLPYFRSGGHVSHGTPIENRFFACGPGVAPGRMADVGKLEDLPVTLLTLMGVRVPESLPGRSLLR